jgi:hypothetical protein
MLVIRELQLPELFSDNLKLSENSDYNCLSGKELANSLPDKLKSMEYNLNNTVLLTSNTIGTAIFRKNNINNKYANAGANVDKGNTLD